LADGPVFTNVTSCTVKIDFLWQRCACQMHKARASAITADVRGSLTAFLHETA
jgi:hypothetical protein